MSKREKRACIQCARNGVQMAAPVVRIADKSIFSDALLIDFVMKKYCSALPLSTNLAENSMRPIAIGRKNWLHLGSKDVGPKIGVIFSIMESCRRLKVPVREYLANTLSGLASRSLQTMQQFTSIAYANKIGI